MRVYWLDTGVLIQNRRRYHTKARVPQFWEWLEAQVEVGRIEMPERVYAEVVKGNDWLVGWTKAKRDRGLCVYPDKATQEQYTIIGDHVEQAKKYNDGHQKDRALRGADLWVIAHAKATLGDSVVSEEVEEKPGDQRVKVVSVCSRLGVTCYDTFKMLDKLKARF